MIRARFIDTIAVRSVNVRYQILVLVKSISSRKSPEQLRKMMGVIVVVCAAFGLTVSEAKTEITCLRTRGMPESTATFSVEAASWPGVKPDDRVCIPRGKRQPQCRPVHRGRPAHTQRMVQLPEYTLELYDRPSAPLELKIRMLRAEVLETMLHDCVTWSPRACHYDTLLRAHFRFFTRCMGWRNHNRADHLISYLDTLTKTGSESIEAT